MADEFLNLPHEEQRDIIVAVAGELNMLPAVAEKDVWVCDNSRDTLNDNGTRKQMWVLVKRLAAIRIDERQNDRK